MLKFELALLSHVSCCSFLPSDKNLEITGVFLMKVQKKAGIVTLQMDTILSSIIKHDVQKIETFAGYIS